MLELDPRKDQLGMGHKQILPDPKTKAWVDEQNRINKEKTLDHDKSYEEAGDTMHPDPQINVEPPVKSQKRVTITASEKEKDTPQPSHALQEFVKHIADPLVDKGWNSHLKFGKGEPQGEQFGPRKDQLGMGCKQILPDPKTRAWVDEQNRINTEKTLGYDKSHGEARDTMHPDPQINIGPPVKSQKRGTVTASEKEKDTPQPSHALQEFVKHIADPLVDKGWNSHLKFGKEEPQGEQFIQGSSPWEPTAKTDKKEEVSKPQISKQIPLEMGTGGGGGGGEKRRNGSKMPPEDKVEIEDHPSENEEDDSSSETSLELNVDPQQLASVRLDRPLLRLRLTPRRRIIVNASGRSGTPPPSGGRTVTVPLHERQNGTRYNQPI